MLLTQTRYVHGFQQGVWYYSVMFILLYAFESTKCNCRLVFLCIVEHRAVVVRHAHAHHWVDGPHQSVTCPVVGFIDTISISTTILLLVLWLSRYSRNRRYLCSSGILFSFEDSASSLSSLKATTLEDIQIDVSLGTNSIVCTDRPIVGLYRTS